MSYRCSRLFVWGQRSLTLAPSIPCSIHTTTLHKMNRRPSSGRGQYSALGQAGARRKRITGINKFDNYCICIGVPADRGGCAIEDIVRPRTVFPSHTTVVGTEEWTSGLDSVRFSNVPVKFTSVPVITFVHECMVESNQLFSSYFKILLRKDMMLIDFILFSFLMPERFGEAKSGIYCGPLKLLASEIFIRSNESGLKCDLVTGEERRFAIDNHHPANHISSTVEMLSTQLKVEVAVIDEIQMLRDDQRGWAWTRALLGVAADEVHLCGEIAAIDIVKKILDPIGEHVEIRYYERKGSLTIADQGLGSLDHASFFMLNYFSFLKRFLLVLTFVIGSFGSTFSNGVVTTLRKEDISIMKSILEQPIEPINSAGIAPTFEQIETFSFHLPQASFVHLLDLFVSVCSVSENYFICTVEQIRALADLIDYIPLPLKVRYTFCVAPISVESKVTASAFIKMVRRFSTGQCLTFDWLMDILSWSSEPAKNLQELEYLERSGSGATTKVLIERTNKVVNDKISSSETEKSFLLPDKRKGKRKSAAEIQNGGAKQLGNEQKI
uniref:Suv3_C_1 domain-containing protein n=1 Tax=Heterorhabditis bacteriophora TaxID=37862 RepID=A0A1I7X6D3_HETBA